jgi:hypothetical protein
VSGTGRRRKPNPDEEGGGLPQPPRPPAGYSPPQQPEYDYAYDWRTPQAAQPQQQPQQPEPRPSGGATFDAFGSPSSGSHAGSGSGAPAQPDQSGTGSYYYNPVGYGLQDPYSASAYAPPQPSAPAQQPYRPYEQPPPTPPQPQAPQPQPQRQPYEPPQAYEPSQQRRPDTSSYGQQSPSASGSYPQASYSAPPAPPRSAAPSPSSPSADIDGFFDEDDLFDTGSSPQASAAREVQAVQAPAPPPSATGANPVVPPPPADAPRPQDGYAAADFAFLEEETGRDVDSWLTFVESRADSRSGRAKRFRRQMIGAGAAVAVVAAGIGAYFLFNGGPLSAKPVTKSVVMLQLSDSTGNAVADALLVTTRSNATAASAKAAGGTGAAVLVPSQMVVNTTGFGEQPFGGVSAQNIPAAGKDTVADTLGVSIDGVWRMDEITFAGLIDELGGVQVTTNAAVPAVTASPTAAAVPQGSEKLTGGQAVAYATYTAKGESTSAQSQRFGQVVAGLLAVLPPDAAAITSYLNHLGIVDDPSLPEAELSPILAALAAEQQAGAFTAKVLPLRTDGTNEMDVQAAGPIVSSLLGGALAAESPGQVNRVLVEDASGHKGAQSQAIRGAAQAKLANSGYTFVDGATVDRRAASVVEVGSADQKSAAVQVAQTLGLQAINVQVVSGLSSLADVTVILGEDWPKLANVSIPTATASTTG